MIYKEIYREKKTNAKLNARPDQFFELTLYECDDDYQAPMLLKVESGNPQDEDWDRHWEIMDIRKYGVQDENQAIREVIKRIDTHVFDEPDAITLTSDQMLYEG